MTLIHNYITHATQSALEEESRMRAKGRVFESMANYVEYCLELQLAGSMMVQVCLFGEKIG